jgi:hypothetical protein
MSRAYIGGTKVEQNKVYKVYGKCRLCGKDFGCNVNCHPEHLKRVSLCTCYTCTPTWMCDKE